MPCQASPAGPRPNATWAPSVLPIGGQYVLYYSAVVGQRRGAVHLGGHLHPTPGPVHRHLDGPVGLSGHSGWLHRPVPVCRRQRHAVPGVEVHRRERPTPEIWSQQLDPAGTGLAGSRRDPPARPRVRAGRAGSSRPPTWSPWPGGTSSSTRGTMEQRQLRGRRRPPAAARSAPAPSRRPSRSSSSGAGLSGPGGETVFADSPVPSWIAFHAWAPGAVGYPHNRDLYLRRLSFFGPLPVVEPAG